MEPRCVMAVHAHPDDECTKGAATMACLSAEGVRTVLVTCTDGAAGDVTDPALLENRTLAEVRSEEVGQAAAMLRFAATRKLGYPDSGASGSVEGAFASVPLAAVVADLVAVIRAERPEVIVTYDAAYAAGHPDHARCHDATLAAFSITSGEAGGPQKLYGARTHSTARLAAMHRWLVDEGLPSPYETAVRAEEEDHTTTRVEVGDFLATARRALSCHRSQVMPDEPWFFAVPDHVLRVIFPWEDFQLLASTVGAPPPGEREASLLERLRPQA